MTDTHTQPQPAGFRPVVIPERVAARFTPDASAAAEGGAAPVLDWIEIDRLVIDEAYQRPLLAGNWTAILRIAARFSWACFSPVLVAPAVGGRFAIIDGQHRVHAAHLAGIESVPCQIVPIARPEQAAAFAAVNGNVVTISAFHIYRAALAAGETWATNMRAVAEAGGCRVMLANASATLKQPGEIYAIRAFRELVEARDHTRISAALAALMAADGFRADAELWAYTVLFPFLWGLTERPEPLRSDRLVAALEDFDVFEAIDRTRDASRDLRRRGQAVTAKDLLAAEINDWLARAFPSGGVA